MAYTNPISNRRFEQFLVLVFLLAPPIGGLAVLAHALKDPTAFGWTLVWLGAIIGLCTMHIVWVRPFFRRYPWMVSLKELSRRGKAAAKRHPRPIRRVWRNRLLRLGYRVLFGLAVSVPLVALYQLHGKHFVWFLVGYAVCGFGITIGYHRVGTHPSFRAPNWLRGLFLTMGSMAMQGPASEWLKKHSKHHAFGETSADVHSPYVFEDSKRGIFIEQVRAFMHSFMMWAFREPSLVRPRGMSVEAWREKLLANPPDAKTFRFREEDRHHWEVKDADGNIVVSTETLIKKRWGKLVETLVKIEKDRVVTFVSSPVFYVTALAVSLGGPCFFGITVWESLARLLFLNWTTFGVNSICHLWGETPFEVPDNSRNNALIEILALGEGGHNTHHKAELWAQHGIFAWQTDFSAWVIKGLRALGLATHVNLPTQHQVVSSWVAWRKREPNMQGYRARPASTRIVEAVVAAGATVRKPDTAESSVA